MFKLVYKSNINCSAKVFSNNLIPRGLYAGLGYLGGERGEAFFIKFYHRHFLALYTMRLCLYSSLHFNNILKLSNQRKLMKKTKQCIIQLVSKRYNSKNSKRNWLRESDCQFGFGRIFQKPFYQNDLL